MTTLEPDYKPLHERVTEAMHEAARAGNEPAHVVFSTRGRTRAFAEEDATAPRLSRDPGKAEATRYMGLPFSVDHTLGDDFKLLTDKDKLPAPTEAELRAFLDELLGAAVDGIDSHGYESAYIKGIPGHPIRGASRYVAVRGRKFVLRLDEVS
jgi:hypothetical protein